METISLTTPRAKQTYAISVSEGLLAHVGERLDLARYSKVFVITDRNLERLWLDTLMRVLPQATPYIALPAGEAAKNTASIHDIWQAMHQTGCDRKALVLTLGGGVVGDMGGFAASTYMRGVAYAHIPTTLLAQVDSSIGGKTGIDFDNVKNLVGTFVQPVAVLIDTKTLTTLPKRELIAGFAEMIKHALIADKAYLGRLARKPPADFTPGELVALITTSVRIKATVVQGDERESGERKILNFGHTIGHAVESCSWASGQPLLHGEAVSIGMAVEAELSQHLGYLTSTQVEHIRHTLHSAGLPTMMPQFPLKAILAKLQSDKKNEAGLVNFSLLQTIGKAVYNQQIDLQTLSAIIMQNMKDRHAQ